MESHTTLDSLMRSLFETNELASWQIFEDKKNIVHLRLRFTKNSVLIDEKSPVDISKLPANKSQSQLSRNKERANRHKESLKSSPRITRSSNKDSNKNVEILRCDENQLSDMTHVVDVSPVLGSPQSDDDTLLKSVSLNQSPDGPDALTPAMRLQTLDYSVVPNNNMSMKTAHEMECATLEYGYSEVSDFDETFCVSEPDETSVSDSDSMASGHAFDENMTPNILDPTASPVYPRALQQYEMLISKSTEKHKIDIQYRQLGLRKASYTYCDKCKEKGPLPYIMCFKSKNSEPYEFEYCYRCYKYEGEESNHLPCLFHVININC